MLMACDLNPVPIISKDFGQGLWYTSDPCLFPSAHPEAKQTNKKSQHFPYL